MAALESAVMDALDFSQPSQLTQTQPQTQPPSQPPGGNTSSRRFPPGLWGVLLSVSGSGSGAGPSAPPREAVSSRLPPPPPPAPPVLARPDRLDLVHGTHTYTIGRSPRCDLVLTGPKISSYQARLTLEEDTGVVRLEDTSTNGTFVGLRKVGKGNVTILESGDTIVFGPPAASFDLEFRYVIQLDPALSATAGAGVEGVAPDPDDEDDDAVFGSSLLVTDTTGFGVEPNFPPPAARRPRSIHAAYEVREQIGKGSFATVRKGVRRSDGLRVAIKVIQRARFAANPKTMEMIQREVEIMKGLEHRFCVKCLDYFEDDQRLWLVLEYVDGGDLLDYVMKRRGLQEAETREIALMVCEAVAYLHSKGITHRDLKPENLLLTRGANPICKVTDFGLAKMVDEGTMLKTMCGTPTYLAPEVILNPTPAAGYGSLVDAWSIGVVLYSCLTNQTPFDESESTPLPQRMRERRVDLGILHQVGVSDVACDFLSRLLVADPKRRMSCAEALRHPWLALKAPSSSPFSAAPVRTSVSAAELLASSSALHHDPPGSPASGVQEDEIMTRVQDEESRTSRNGEADDRAAVAEGEVVTREDSGVDSQGFGNLRINGTTHSPLRAGTAAGVTSPNGLPPAYDAPNKSARRPSPVPPFSPPPTAYPPSEPTSALSSTTTATTATKRKQPMSTFSSDSSLSDPPDSLASGSESPPPSDLFEQHERDLVEPAARPVRGAATGRTGTSAQRGRGTRGGGGSGGGTPTTPGRRRRTTPAATVAAVTASPTSGKRSRVRASPTTTAGTATVIVGLKGGADDGPADEIGDGGGGGGPEVGGIAAAVKGRRRKAARLY